MARTYSAGTVATIVIVRVVNCSVSQIVILLINNPKGILQLVFISLKLKENRLVVPCNLIISVLLNSIEQLIRSGSLFLDMISDIL